MRGGGGIQSVQVTFWVSLVPEESAPARRLDCRIGLNGVGSCSALWGAFSGSLNSSGVLTLHGGGGEDGEHVNRA